MELKINRIPLIFSTVFLSAVAFWFGTGLHPMWWLTWFAALPVLFAASRLPGWLTFVAAAGTYALGALNIWHYLSFMPLPIHLILLIVPACAFGFGIVLYRACLRHHSYWQAGLALPSFWVAFEFLSALTSPHGTFGSLAYSQMDFLPLIQIASIAGTSGVSFCPLLFSSVVAIMLANSGWTAAKTSLVACSAVLLAATVLFGYWRLQMAVPTRGISIGLIASDLPENLYARTNEASLGVFRRLTEQVPALAAHGAKIVVMSEHTGAFIDASLHGNDAAADKLFADAARQNRVLIVAAIDHAVSSSLLYNEARIYEPDGGPAVIYHKRYLLPGMEFRFTPGATDTVVNSPVGRLGIAICKDMDFPVVGRQYGREGAVLILVPANDFHEDAWLHARMAILRGVEGGFSIARSASLGQLTLSDDRGRVVAERASDAAPIATLVATLPVGRDPTFYDRFGDVFAWLTVAALGFVLLTGPWKLCSD